MRYLIIALINLVYGVLLLATLSQSTPGFWLILFIAAVLTLIGLIGLGLWFWKTVMTSKSSDQTTALKEWYSIAKGVDVLLIIGLLFRSFVLQPFLVEGQSMEPSFHDREFLLVDRISYDFRLPQRGQVIIFRYPKDPTQDYIKRIIGLPGDRIKISDGQVAVNGTTLNESYLLSGTPTLILKDPTETYETTLKTDEYFVLGDNRDNSSDSRDWGTVPKSNIIGRAWFVVSPLKYFGRVKTPTANLGQYSFRFNSHLL